MLKGKMKTESTMSQVRNLLNSYWSLKNENLHLRLEVTYYYISPFNSMVVCHVNIETKIFGEVRRMLWAVILLHVVTDVACKIPHQQ